MGKECFVSLSATLRLCGYTPKPLIIPVSNDHLTTEAQSAQRTMEIVGFLRQAHEPTENSDEPEVVAEGEIPIAKGKGTKP